MTSSSKDHRYEQDLNIFLYAFFCIGFSVYFIFSVLKIPLIGADDANIVFVYAKNFVSGYGIVYNSGSEHVEGYSSFLYFLVCSIFFFLSSKPELAILGFNLILAILSCFLMLHSFKKLAQIYKLSFLNCQLIYGFYLIWLLMNPLYFAWNVVSLMDSGIYGFLLIAAYGYFMELLLSGQNSSKHSLWTSVLIMLILLCRPEGFLWAMVFVLSHGLIQYMHEQDLLRAVKLSRVPLITYFGTSACLTLFRLFYFGYPLPNTYYAKVSANFFATLRDGYAYFHEYEVVYGFLIFLPVFFLFFWVLYMSFSEHDKKENRSIRYLAWITLFFTGLGLILPIIEGGDHFHGFRFYQASYPFLITPLMLLLLQFRNGSLWNRTFIGLLFLSLTAYGSEINWHVFLNSNNNAIPIQDLRLSIAMEFNIAARSRENALALNEIFKDQLPTIGYGSAGGITYEYKGKVYDMMGLNNTLLAHADRFKSGPKGHQAFNKKVFYRLAPDLLMPTAVPNFDLAELQSAHQYYTDVNGWDNLIFKNIFNDDDFKQAYTLALIQNVKETKISCYAYVNNHYLEQLMQNESFKVLRFKPYDS